QAIDPGAKEDQKFDLFLAEDYDWQGPLDAFKDRKIMMTGRLKAPDGYAHDIDEVKFEFVALSAEDMAAAKAKAQAEAKAKADSDLETDAMAACQQEFSRRATHPSTVDFPMFDGKRAIEHKPDGSILYQAAPYAENSFGAKLRFIMRCRFKDGKVDG